MLMKWEWRSKINVHTDLGTEALHRIAIIKLILLSQQVIRLYIETKSIVERIGRRQVQLVDIVHLVLAFTIQLRVATRCQIVVQSHRQLVDRANCNAGIQLHT